MAEILTLASWFALVFLTIWIAGVPWINAADDDALLTQAHEIGN